MLRLLSCLFWRGLQSSLSIVFFSWKRSRRDLQTPLRSPHHHRFPPLSGLRSLHRSHPSFRCRALVAAPHFLWKWGQPILLPFSRPLSILQYRSSSNFDPWRTYRKLVGTNIYLLGHMPSLDNATFLLDISRGIRFEIIRGLYHRVG